MSERGGTRVPRWLVPLVVVAIAIALIVVIVANTPDEDAEAAASTTQSATGASEQPKHVGQFSQLERRDADDLLGFGDVDAPVVLIVYSDYQCGYCAKWSTTTLPQLMPYVDRGDLRIEWRDVNVFGEASQRAAQASYAAAMQGEYWAFHDALFDGGEPRSASDLSQESLVALASQLGLDEQQLADDMAAEATVAQVEQNMQEGLSLGVTGTPTFLLGGEPIVGNQAPEKFIAVIDAMLDAL